MDSGHEGRDPGDVLRTRISDETHWKPKPLIETGGVPVIEAGVRASGSPWPAMQPTQMLRALMPR